MTASRVPQPDFRQREPLAVAARLAGVGGWRWDGVRLERTEEVDRILRLPPRAAETREALLAALAPGGPRPPRRADGRLPGERPRLRRGGGAQARKEAPELEEALDSDARGGGGGGCGGGGGGGDAAALGPHRGLGAISRRSAGGGGDRARAGRQPAPQAGTVAVDARQCRRAHRAVEPQALRRARRRRREGCGRRDGGIAC